MVACSYFDSFKRLYQFHQNLMYLELWLYILCWHFHIKQSVQTPLTNCNLITKDLENPKINVDFTSVVITQDWVSVRSGVNVLFFIQSCYRYPSLGFNISLSGFDFFMIIRSHSEAVSYMIIPIGMLVNNALHVIPK